MSRFGPAWERFWFRPAAPANLIAARIILAASALWIVLSRPDLPDVLGWPLPFQAGFGRSVSWRFLSFGLPLAAERALFLALGAALVATLIGFRPRATGALAALLLYHFAPLMDPLRARGGPYFLGLTIPVLGLLLLSFGQAPRRGALPSPEWRWPLAAIQICFAATYVLSGISKLASAGPAWATPANFEGLVLGMAFPDSIPPWARLFVGHPALSGVGAAAGLLLDFVAPVALFVPRAAPWAIVALLAAHLAIVPIFGVCFLGLPGLLLFVDWSGLGPARATAPEAPQRAAR